MERVREAIDEILSARGIATSDRDWARIQELILAAQPPGEEEITAAMLELEKSLKNEQAWLERYRNGNYAIYIYQEGIRHRLGGCDAKENLAAAIRALIPKPEPTVEQSLSIIEHLLVCPPYTEEQRQQAIDACNHIRKRLKDQ